MNSFYLACAITIFFWTSLLVWRFVRLTGCHDKMSVLRKRLRDYAVMKDRNQLTSSCQISNINLLLSPGEHEILLGILKKVEAKNGVLATIWSLFFAGIITAASAGFYLETQSEAATNAKAFAATSSLFIIMGIPFLVASIIGTRQIDNFLVGSWQNVRDVRKSSILLQDALMKDALLKEEMLWISQRAAVLYALILPILATIKLWESVI